MLSKLKIAMPVFMTMVKECEANCFNQDDMTAKNFKLWSTALGKGAKVKTSMNAQSGCYDVEEVPPRSCDPYDLEIVSNYDDATSFTMDSKGNILYTIPGGMEGYLTAEYYQSNFYLTFVYKV